MPTPRHTPTLPSARTRLPGRRRARLALGAGAGLAALALAACGGSHSTTGSGPVTAAGCGGVRHCPYTAASSIGRRGGGVLRVPEAVAIAPSGEVYVGDQFSFVVQRFSPEGRFLGQWGSYGTGLGQFGSVGALAVGEHGDVYVVDSTNDRVEAFTATGRFLRAWGSPGTGLGQFRFGGGGRAEIPPGGGIAAWGAHVYVADSGGDRIERFTLQGTHPTVFGGPGSGPGRFADPRGLTAADGRLYVADDQNHRVQVLTLHGRFIAQTPPANRGVAHLADPYDVAVNAAGEVFVADDNNNRIVRFTPRLTYSAAWRKLNRSGEALGYIRALAVDANGAVFVADSARDQIGVFDRNGVPLRQWGVSGQSLGQFDAPLDVSSDGEGGFLVIEGYGSRARVQRLDGSLTVRQSWSGGGDVILGKFFFSPTAVTSAAGGSFWTTYQTNGLIRHFSASGALLGAVGHARAAPPHFSYPSGIATGPDGRLYVADTAHGRVVVLDRHGHLLGQFPRGGATLGSPVALAVDRRGDVYVADAAHNRIDVFSPAGTPLRSWNGSGDGGSGLEDPDGLAIDGAGDVFVSDADHDRIDVFSPDGRLLRRFGAPGIRAGQLNHPGGLTVDCHGSVIVADTDNNRLEVFAGAAAPTGRCASDQ